MSASPSKNGSKTVELAFGSRPTTKPPPYSEVEHIGVEDLKFALYLANCDTEDTTVRKTRDINSIGPSTTAAVKMDEGENKCTRPGCLDVIRRINAAGKKNRDEQADILFEQKIADDDLKDVEALVAGLEEDFARVEADTNNYEMNKSEMAASLKNASEKKQRLLKDNLDLANRIMVAQSEKSKRTLEIQSLAHTISNLMWRGKRLTTAEDAASRSYIPNIHISRSSPQTKEKAESIASTSYYGKKSVFNVPLCISYQYLT
jgi:hypothetical protein